MRTFFSRKSLRILPIILTACMIAVFFPGSAVSADEAISLSVSGNQEVGSKVTVSATISGSGPYSGFDGQITYDDKILSLDAINAGNFDAANFKVSGSKFLVYDTTIPGGSVLVSATFSCIAEGTSGVSLELNSLGDMNGQDIPVSAVSTSVLISKPVPKSSNALLSSLSVSPGDLSPSFSANTFEYSAQVGSDISRITISANTQDAKAKISLNGVQDKLIAGKNNVKITVTAEDGSVRIYTIAVNRSAGPTPTLTPTPKPLPLIYIDEVAYSILTAGPNDAIPEGFAPTTANYANTAVPALVRSYGEAQDKMELVLLYLANDSNSAYYVYDRLNQSFYPFISMQTLPDYYTYAGPAPETMIPAGYEPFALQFQEQSVTAYRLISDPDFMQCLLYLMNSHGVSSFYVYDTEAEAFIPYRGEILLLTPTPIPTPAPTTTPIPELSVQTTQTTDVVLLVPENQIPNDASSVMSFPSLLDYRNPVVLLFYLLCLIVLALLILIVRLMMANKSRRRESEAMPSRQDSFRQPEAILFSRDAMREKKRSNREHYFTEDEDPDLENQMEAEAMMIRHPIILEPQNNQVKAKQKDIPAFDYPPVFEKKNHLNHTSDTTSDLPIRPGNNTGAAENKKPAPQKGLLFGDPDDE